MDELKPNYYAVIPANVRYDTDIPPNAKLLYGEITSLCNQKGYCWATNDYFSSLYGVSERTIQNLLKQLFDKNYIKIEIKDNHKRLIYLNFTNHEKNFVGGTKNTSYQYENNFTHNNKMNIKEEYMNELIINDALNASWLDFN